MSWCSKGSRLPPAPAGFDPESLKAFTPHWHQRWEVFDGVWTPGRNPIADLAARAELPARLDGLRVLDIGAFNGCLSFECERRGAEQVIALDLCDENNCGFAPMKQLLGSRVQFVQGTSYQLDPAVLGAFDVVLFFGVLYHLRYPLLALDQLKKVCCGTLYVETVVLDRRVVVAGSRDIALDDIDTRLSRIPLWQFFPGSELGGDSSNWFSPNVEAVLAGLRTAGFNPELLSVWNDRAAFRATVQPRTGREALGESYESMSGVSRRALALD